MSEIININDILLPQSKIINKLVLDLLEKYKKNKNIILKLLEYNPNIIKYIRKKDQDYEICLKAIKLNHHNLKYVSKRFYDEKLIFTVIKKDFSLIEKIKKKYQTENICYHVIRSSTSYFEFFDKKFYSPRIITRFLDRTDRQISDILSVRYCNFSRNKKLDWIKEKCKKIYLIPYKIIFKNLMHIIFRFYNLNFLIKEKYRNKKLCLELYKKVIYKRFIYKNNLKIDFHFRVRWDIEHCINIIKNKNKLSYLKFNKIL